MKLTKRILTLALAVAMIFGVMGLASCGSNPAGDNTKIKIGLTGPLTGGAAIYGVAVRNAAQLAVDEINAAGGLSNGVQFELDMKDDEHKAEKVAALYASLYESGMQVSLGTVTTAPGKEFKELAKEDNVFFITPSATADVIPEHANGYQMCFADSDQGTASAKYFNDNFQGKVIGILYKNDDEYSNGIYQKFMESISADLKPADSNIKTFTDATATTFTQQITDLADCDVIFMPIYYGPASTFMKQGKDTIKADAIYYGCDGFDGITGVEGFDINAIPQEVSYLSHFNSNATEGPAAEFIAKYNEKYDEEKEPLNQFGAAAYDCVYAIRDALNQAIANGEDVSATTSASDMCEILKGVFDNGFVFHGITGKCEGTNKSTISWDANGKVVKEAVKYVVKEKTAQ
ncbi:MAG: ABC transporter substrate-binding protein [Clostridia bacterium]|nr:ABC transporter substrate-binding protein [Clostridia bacterium]